MLVEITEVEVRAGTRVFLRFDDGVEGEIDLAEATSFTGVFERLRDPTFFAGVSVDPDWGCLRWSKDLDLAPEPLYERITGRNPMTMPEARP